MPSRGAPLLPICAAHLRSASGPPRSGKTTFLKTLAGLNRATPGLKVRAGELTYNGHPFSEFVVQRSAAYISQRDDHYGELTVRETLAFATRCFGAKPLRDLLEVLQDKEEALGITPDPDVDAFMKASAWGGSNTVDAVVRSLRKKLGPAADRVETVRGIGYRLG